MADRVCPSCKTLSSARIRRTGVLQTLIFPILHLYPWECAFCAHIYFDRARGTTPTSNNQAQNRPSASSH